MTTGCYILLQNPRTFNYPYLEVIDCCLDIFDEILIIDGGTNDGSFFLLPEDKRIKIKKRVWPEDASWDYAMEQYNFGLQNLSTDWAVKMDADYLFHEKDIPKIKELLQREDLSGLNFEKDVFNLVDRYRSKTKICLAVNKKKHPNVRVNRDEEFEADKIFYDTDFETTGIPLYVYDRIFQTKEDIGAIMHKFAKAAAKRFNNNWGYKSKQAALDYVVDLARNRIDGHNQNIIPLDAHPKYIQDRIKLMTEDMLGYSLFGHKIASYFENN